MSRTGPVEHSNVGQGFLHSGVAQWRSDGEA